MVRASICERISFGTLNIGDTKLLGLASVLRRVGCMLSLSEESGLVDNRVYCRLDELLGLWRLWKSAVRGQRLK